MSRVNTYLNFPGNAEEAFTYYADVFGSRVVGLTRFRDNGGVPGIGEDESDKVLHAEVTILNGHVLMATDALESMGQRVRVGNNTTISLETDTREDADRLFLALSDGGSEMAGMMEMFFGYWGTCLDRFGVRWMINFREE
ncbi:MAG: VOC family protein [Acidobacteriota bacterium]|nr:VOC family protein [Acidobacteriota bacterium]